MSLNFIDKTVSISDEFGGYSIWKYIKILRPDWTKVFIIKQLRNKEISVGNQKIPFNYKLKVNDKVTYRVYKDEKKLKTRVKLVNTKSLKPLNVVYEDKHLLIVNKEPKVSVQPSAKYVLQNMQNRLWKHLDIDPQGTTWKPSFVHRLDHNTTGLLIAAKTLAASQKLSEDLKNRKINKWYKALVVGTFPNKTVTIKNWINKEGEKIKISNEPKRGYKECISEITLIKNYAKTSLVEVQIFTGRKHQIRIHLSNMGFSICGDFKYGTRTPLTQKYPYTALCAWRLEFLSDHACLKGVKSESIYIDDVWFDNKSYLL